MGCIPSKQAKDAATKAVDAAADNKDKVVAGVKTAGEKVGVDKATVDNAAQKVDAALSDKEGLKAKVGLGGDAAAPAAEAAPATQA